MEMNPVKSGAYIILHGLLSRLTYKETHIASVLCF